MPGSQKNGGWEQAVVWPGAWLQWAHMCTYGEKQEPGFSLWEKRFTNTAKEQSRKNPKMLNWNWRLTQDIYIHTHRGRFRNSYRYVCMWTHTYTYMSIHYFLAVFWGCLEAGTVQYWWEPRFPLLNAILHKKMLLILGEMPGSRAKWRENSKRAWNIVLC